MPAVGASAAAAFISSYGQALLTSSAQLARLPQCFLLFCASAAAAAADGDGGSYLANGNGRPNPSSGCCRFSQQRCSCCAGSRRRGKADWLPLPLLLLLNFCCRLEPIPRISRRLCVCVLDCALWLCWSLLDARDGQRRPPVGCWQLQAKPRWMVVMVLLDRRDQPMFVRAAGR